MLLFASHNQLFRSALDEQIAYGRQLVALSSPPTTVNLRCYDDLAQELL